MPFPNVVNENLQVMFIFITQNNVLIIVKTKFN